jgi:hypothetical protein
VTGSTTFDRRTSTTSRRHIPDRALPMSVFTGPSVAHWVALRQLARAASAAAGWWHSPIAARRWRGSARDCRGRCRGLIPTAAAAISSQGSGGLYLKRGKLEVAACWPRTLPAPSPPSWSTSRAANSPISRAVRARDRPGADAASEFAASRQGDRNRRANRANGRTAVFRWTLLGGGICRYLDAAGDRSCMHGSPRHDGAATGRRGIRRISVAP